MLIIGCGNRQRGDDAAGIMVVERLRALGIPGQVCAGECSELMEAWTGVDDAIVIDAVVTGAPAGALQVWDGRHPLELRRSGASTHGLGVGEAIELARAMNCLPSRLRVYGIEGKSFEIGAAVSPEVARAVDLVVQRIVSALTSES